MVQFQRPRTLDCPVKLHLLVSHVSVANSCCSFREDKRSAFFGWLFFSMYGVKAQTALIYSPLCLHYKYGTIDFEVFLHLARTSPPWTRASPFKKEKKKKGLTGFFPPVNKLINVDFTLTLLLPQYGCMLGCRQTKQDEGVYMSGVDGQGAWVGWGGVGRDHRGRNVSSGESCSWGFLSRLSGGQRTEQTPSGQLECY